VLGDRVIGVIIYELQGSRAIFRHTIVEPESRGHSVGAALVRAALDDLAANGMSLTNYCSFVTDFIARNPGYAGLLDSAQPGPRRAGDAG
jgi:predicted GNAT family acetyltransferase